MGKVAGLLAFLVFASGCALNGAELRGMNVNALISIEDTGWSAQNAVEDCDVEADIKNAISENAHKAGLNLNYVTTGNGGAGKLLKVTVDGVSPGEFSETHLFAVSKIRFLVELSENGKLIAKGRKVCETSHGGALGGLGFTACTRLQKSAECVGVFTNRWLAKVI